MTGSFPIRIFSLFLGQCGSIMLYLSESHCTNVAYMYLFPIMIKGLGFFDFRNLSEVFSENFELSSKFELSLVVKAIDKKVSSKFWLISLLGILGTIFNLFN